MKCRVLSVFWISHAIKNDPKIKVLRMLWKFNTIFSEYLRISCANNIRGRCTRWAQPTWACQDPQTRPIGLWSPCGQPHLSLYTTSSPTSRKNSPLLSLSDVLALKPVDFDLFARSSVFETVPGDCCLVCDSSVCPISFCFSGLYFE